MTHAEFRRMQAVMDEAGLITCIRTIRVSKVFVKVKTEYDDAFKMIYRYKYKYEVILNGRIIHHCKARKTAKNKLLELYEEKMTATSI